MGSLSLVFLQYMSIYLPGDANLPLIVLTKIYIVFDSSWHERLFVITLYS